MAATIERDRTLLGDYPAEWPGVAWLVKSIAGWRCERCGRPNSGTNDGFCLTVHHLDGLKSNLQLWNLAALCAKCHLKIQSRVNFYQVWAFEHSRWMAVHVDGYNEWAAPRGLPLLPLVGIVDRDYSKEWA
jgi:hypothetical protein